MKRHHYRVTLEYLADADGAPVSAPPLRFEVDNHDEILGIVEKLRARGDFDAESAAAFGVGLKLFSEVMIEHRNHPLFAAFRPHFLEFMKELKKGPAAG